MRPGLFRLITNGAAQVRIVTSIPSTAVRVNGYAYDEAGRLYVIATL